MDPVAHPVRTSVAGEGISPRQLLKVEQQASMSAEETMAYWAGKVPLGRNRMLGDVRTDIAEVLPGEVRVASTRYDLDSGSVVVELVVDLVTLAGPWLRATAETMPIQTEEAGASGVVLDARGLDIRPSLAPQIVDAEGTVIWGGQVWSNLQKAVPPVRWATDPTDHAVRVAGNVPRAVHCCRGHGHHARVVGRRCPTVSSRDGWSGTSWLWGRGDRGGPVTDTEWRVSWRGRLKYADALAEQTAHRELVIRGEAPNTVWMLEHEPVVTRWDGAVVR